MIKIIFGLLHRLMAFLPLVVLLHAFQAQALQEPNSISPQEIKVYVSQGCPHYEAAKAFTCPKADFCRWPLRVAICQSAKLINPSAIGSEEDLHT
jgi:hypothetical protein